MLGCGAKIKGEGNSSDFGSGGDTGQTLSKCQDDEFESEPATSAKEAVCVHVSDCLPGQFEKVAASLATDRECKTCPSGTFSTQKNALACSKWSECVAGKFESVEPDSATDRVCNSCGPDLFEDGTECQSLTVCAHDEYESSPASAARDRVCKSLTQCDSTTEYQTEAPTSTSDRVCSTLSTCPLGTSANQPTATKDRVCSPCENSYSTTEDATTCLPWTVECGDNEYVSRQASELVDRECQACPRGTFSTGPNATSCQGISAGWNHACFVDTADGVVTCWGDDSYGQSTAPTDVAFSSVSAGGYHTCGVRQTDKKVECWGLATGGQTTPINDFYQGVSAGGHHTCGHLVDGEVRCWGSFDQSRAPIGSFTKISSGGMGHACGLRADGSVSCFGDNSADQALVPDEMFLDVDSWGAGGCAVRADRTVLCWGNNNADPFTLLAGTFDALSIAFNTDPTYAYVNTRYICGMLSDGSLSCNESSYPSGGMPPLEVARPDLKFSTVSLGKDYGCGIVKSDRKVACWGWDESIEKTGRYLPPAAIRH